MLRVGLTGGIGAGKSTIAARLAGLGAVVIDADVLAREVVAVGTAGLAEITATFGPGVLAADGSLDRAALAATVFADPAARDRLNAMVHPLVHARTAALLAEARPDAVVVQDVPLIVENGLAPGFHVVVVVHAPIAERLRRLAGRGLAEADARARIAAQADDGARRAVADVWLDNAGPPEEVLAEVDRLWHRRLVPFEANLRLGRPAPAPSAGFPVADPTWAEQAARLLARVARACQASPADVQHVGPTAVPGLPAPDVIDLQLAVGDDAGCAAAGRALPAAGFVPRAGGTGSCSADPGRPALVSVRLRGSPEWRRALLARDWLRADADARDRYRGAAHPARWLAAASGGMERWAITTGWSPGSAATR